MRDRDANITGAQDGIVGLPRGRRGRRRPPTGSGPRIARILTRYAQCGDDLNYAEAAREMGVTREKVWRWVVEGRFPGRGPLTEHFSRLPRVRKEGADPSALATWVELGPDDSAPWSQPVTLDDRADPRTVIPRGVIEPAQPVTSASAAFSALVVDGIERILAAAKRGEDPVPLLERLGRLAREAKQLGLAAFVFGTIALLTATRADAQTALDSGSSVRKHVQVQVLSSAIALLKWLLAHRLLALLEGASGPLEPGPLNPDPVGPNPSSSALGGRGVIIHPDDLVEAA